MAVIDLLLVYSMIKRLATPFKEWPAYKLGIIDEDGNLLKPRKDRKTIAEREAYGIYDNMIRKLKRLIEKIPGGKTRIASYAAALYLIKEGVDADEEVLAEKLEHYMTNLNEDFVNTQFESMVAGGGLVAGLPPDEPPVNQSKVLTRNKKKKKKPVSEEKRGLWANIHAKRKRIQAGSKERMRKPGEEGRPTSQDFKDASSEEVLAEKLEHYMTNLNEDFVNTQFESMVADGGLVAGLPPDDPIVTKKSQRQIVRRNFLKKKRVVKEAVSGQNYVDKMKSDVEKTMESLKNQVQTKTVWNQDFQQAKSQINRYIDKLHDAIMHNHYLPYVHSLSPDQRKQVDAKLKKSIEAYYHQPAMHTANTTKKHMANFVKDFPKSKSEVDEFLAFQQKAKTLFDDAKSHIVKGRKPSTNSQSTPMRTVENTGSCGICGKNVKLSRTGKILSHGYTLKYRFGKSSDCIGTHFDPIEVSPQAPKAMLDYINRWIKQVDDKIEDEDDWSKIAKYNDQITYLEKRYKEYEKIIKNWKAGVLPGELMGRN